jgi:hypothetical protein
MARFDYPYLQNLIATHLASSVSLLALATVAVSASLWHFRPYYAGGNVRSGIALFALSLAAYILGSYFVNPALHSVSLVGMYLAFVTLLAGKRLLVSMGPSLLPLVAIFAPGFVAAPISTVLEAAAVAAVTGYVAFLWWTRGVVKPICGHCFESKLSRQRFCLLCGRQLNGAEISFPRSILGYGGALSAAILVLSLAAFPVLVTTPTGPSYTAVGIGGTSAPTPLWSLNSTSPKFQASTNYQGVARVYVYSGTQSNSNITLWTVVSRSRLSNLEFSVIFPGFSSNATQRAPANMTSEYTWKYQGTSFTGSVGSSPAYSIDNGSVNKVFVSYLAGTSSRTKPNPQLESPTTGQISDRLRSVANFGFFHQSYVALIANSQYLESAVSVVLLLGVVRTARGRDVGFARAMENAEGLSGNELALLAAAVSSKKDETGKDILDELKWTFGVSWYELLPTLLKFQELGLLEAKIRSDHGVPLLKWVSRFR